MLDIPVVGGGSLVADMAGECSCVAEEGEVMVGNAEEVGETAEGVEDAEGVDVSVVDAEEGY